MHEWPAARRLGSAPPGRCHWPAPGFCSARQRQANLTPLESPEPELTYLFKHLVTHEVGYESIAYATRTQLHGQYAAYLEQNYPDQLNQFSSQLAHHYEKAGIQDKARFYLSRSGELAAANFANEEALVYFNRALNFASSGSASGGLRIRFSKAASSYVT